MGAFDPLIYGYRTVQADGVDLDEESTLDFVGFACSEDPSNGRTKVGVSGGGWLPTLGSPNNVLQVNAGGTASEWRDYIGLGATPATLGSVRLPAQGSIRVKEQLGSGGPNVGLLRGGVADDNAYLGFAATSTDLPDNTLIDAATSVVTKVASTPVLTCAAALITAAQSVSLADATYLGLGTTAVATAGTIRLRNGASVYARNAANTANLRLAYLSGTDVFELGSDSAATLLYGSTSVQTWVGAARKIYVTGSVIGLEQPVAYGSGTVAAAGDERQDASHVAAARNAANTADLTTFAWDGADSLHVGGALGGSRPAALWIEPEGWGRLGCAGASKVIWNTTDLQIFSSNIQMYAGTGGPVASTGDVRYRSGGTAYGRNNADDANGLIWSWTWSGTKDELTFGDVTNVDNAYLCALEVVSIKCGANTPIQVQPALIGLNESVQIGAAKDLDCMTNGAYLKPRRLAQDAQPTPQSGEILLWRDTNDSDRIWLVYEATTGTKKVELT